jgi:hypothetical protein
MRLVKAQQIDSLKLSPSEQVQACCMLVREKLEVGDYDAGWCALSAVERGRVRPAQV